MVWVLVFGGIALAGLVMVACYAVWLAHKAADLMSEVHQLGRRAAELAGLVGQVQTPQQRPGDDLIEDRIALDADLDPRSAT